MENFDSYIGTVFSERYTVINVIGIGEYSVVFGAYDTRENQTVALKLLRPEFNDDQTVAERFTTEAELMAMLSHPNIVKIYDTCLEGDYRYFVMEYIEGITLKKHILGKGALDVDEILFLSRQILSALSAIHEKGIVHSDIKPQNVVVLPDGHVCLMDFGISKLQKAVPAEKAGETSLDSIFSDEPFPKEEESSEFAVGTVHYVSPEQAEGRAVDHQSDIYSFGVMLYEMTTGILPFFGDSAYQVALMHVRLQPLAPTRLDPNIPMGLEKIILRAMEKLPIARFATAKEMQKALDEFAVEYHTVKVEEEPTELTFWQKTKKLFRDYIREFSLPSFVMGSLCALLLVIVGGLAIVSGAVVSERNHPEHVKVPDLVGKELTSALEELDESRYQFNIQYVDSDEHQGRIIKQSPSQGTIAKSSGDKKCVIDLTVASRSLPPTMPDLRLLPYDEVADLLRAYDCEVTVIEQPHAYIQKGLIIDTSPRVGTTSTYDLTIYVSIGWPENNQTE